MMNATIKTAMEKALNHQVPDRSLLVDMLNFDIESEEYFELREVARQVAREVENTGKIWASIGIDSQPCPMNCRFCSFGEAWSVLKDKSCLEEETVMSYARHYVSQGARWITLRTTEDYDSDKLFSLAADIRYNLPGTYGLVANTGDITANCVDRMKDNGYEIIYHALRLREGADTPFDPASRINTLEKIAASSLDLAYLTEPVGTEHTSEEIADSILSSIQVGAKLSGAMARVPVPGTPLYDNGQISEERLAQIIAVSRIAGGYNTPDICAHPPSKLAVEFGANVLVAETGTVPRDDKVMTEDWNGYSIELEKQWFKEAGYELWEDNK